MRPAPRIALVVAAAALLSACGGRLPGDAAATVDGAAITVAQVREVVLAQTTDPAAPGAEPAPERYGDVADLQRAVITELIVLEVVTQALQDLGLRVAEEDVEQRLAEEAERLGGEEEFQRVIEEQGISAEEARERIRRQLIEEVLREHFAAAAREEVTEEQLRQAYRERRDTQYTVAEASQVLVESRQEAEEVVQLLEEGADVAELAEERSQDPLSAEFGGNIGEIPVSQLSEEPVEAGDVLGPFESQQGFHVVKVMNVRVRPFADVEQELRQLVEGQASQRALEEWLQSALAAAEVEVRPRFGEWDPISGRVVADPLVPDQPPVVDGRELLPSPAGGE